MAAQSFGTRRLYMLQIQINSNIKLREEEKKIEQEGIIWENAREKKQTGFDLSSVWQTIKAEKFWRTFEYKKYT